MINLLFSTTLFIGSKEGTVNLKYEKLNELKVEPDRFTLAPGKKTYVNLKYT